MLKTFTDNEGEYIKKTDRRSAGLLKAIKLYGVRETTVDEIVKRANIPKDILSLFYKSKELLFYEVLCLFHDELHADLMCQLEVLEKPLYANQKTERLLGLYKNIEASFLYKLITSGEIEVFLRKLPQEVARAHARRIISVLNSLFSSFPA